MTSKRDKRVFWVSTFVLTIVVCALASVSLVSCDEPEPTAEPSYTLDGQGVRRMAWHPDGSVLALATANGTIRFWNPDNRMMSDARQLKAGNIQSLVWHPSGTRLVLVYEDDTILDFDVATNQSEAIQFDEGVGRAWWNDAGDMLGVYFPSLNGGELQVFDANTYLPIAQYPADRINVWSPDGSRIAEMQERGIQIWNVKDWDDEFLSGIFWLYRHPDSILRGDIRWRPDSRYIAHIEVDGFVTIFNVHSGQNILTLNEDSFGSNPQESGSWSHDGNMYVSHDGGTMKVWSVHIPERLEASLPERELLFDSNVREGFYINVFLWNGEGTKIAGNVQRLVADVKHEIWLWDLENESAYVLGRFDWISDVVWRPHSDLLVADITDEGTSTILFWDTNDIQIDAVEDLPE